MTQGSGRKPKGLEEGFALTHRQKVAGEAEVRFGESWNARIQSFHFSEWVMGNP